MSRSISLTSSANQLREPDRESAQSGSHTRQYNSSGQNDGQPSKHQDHAQDKLNKTNGVHSEKDAEKQREPPRSHYAAAIQTFSPIWFAIVMNTGVLGQFPPTLKFLATNISGIIMHQTPQPYNGRWWFICSCILYVTSLVLFCSFVLVLLLRAILYPKTVPGPGAKQPSVSAEEISISACIPISILTLIDQTIYIASDANWNGTGHGFMLFCYVAWWVVVVWILITTQATYVNLTRTSAISPDTLPPACIIPGVGVVTAAVVGASVVTYGYDVSPQLAVPVIIVGYILIGWGIFWALFVYATFFIRSLNAGWLPPEKIPTLLFLVGPPGQTAGALMALGSAAQKHFPNYGDDSPIFTLMGGQSFAATSALFALIFLGLYALWLIYSIYGILEAAFAGKIKSFTFTWWGTIFPTATGNLAFVFLADGFNSQAFAVLSCIWLVVLFIDYFACWIFTIIGIVKGDLLDGREEDEKEARQKSD